MRKFGIAMLIFYIGFGIARATPAFAEEYNVYQVFRPIDLGESDHTPPKDIYINMGSSQGVRKGTVLDVYRKISSFDNLTQRLVGDHMIPVGKIKVIHSDEKTAIARVDRFVSIDQEPALLPQAIMIGDVVRPAN